MKILAAEDHAVARTLLCRALHQLGHEVVEAADGAQAWALFQADPVRVVVSDWMMPKIDGLELCRRIRARPDADYVYFILLTQLDGTAENKHAAADAGVDDFLHKPLNADELWTRLRTAERIIHYATRVRQLERLLPICSYCKKIRSDQNYWQEIESYLLEHSGSHFSHSVCPDCYKSIVIPQMLEAGIRPPPLPPT